MIGRRAAAGLLVLLALTGAAEAQPRAPMETVEHAVCRLIETEIGRAHV